MARKKISIGGSSGLREAIARPYQPKPRDVVNRNMAAIRATENRTEVLLRSHLHRLGLRFRKYSRTLPGAPDIVFASARVAVFVDGDFWHARALREHGLAHLTRQLRTPTREYWIAKFIRRVERDDEVNAALRAQGWHVLRFWESEVKAHPGAIAGRVHRTVQRRLLRVSHG